MIRPRPLTTRERSELASYEAAYRSLIWQYGPERAHAIEAGLDRRTNEDLARWRKLGAS